MFIIGSKKIRSYEKGLLFRDKEFKRVLGTGRHWFIDPLNKVRVDVVSQRAPWFAHVDLDMIVKANVLGEDANVLDLKDYERALVWVDGRFDRILDSGRYAIWTKFKDVKVEIEDARNVLFDHKDLNVILKSQDVEKILSVFTIEEGHVGVYFKDGEYVKTLQPGQYASWMRVGKVKLYNLDMREKVLDVSGQEIMTADKVSLRMNAVVSYRVTDARKSIEQVNDADQALYREAQLALRGIVGTRELDVLLADKNAVAKDLETSMRKRADEFGVRVITLGIRDIILPGEMKALLNQVIEAKKASEANAIARREETAAVRSQMNTAKLMDSTPSLMRLRELEVLERVAQTSKLSVVLGEKGLADRVVNLL
jgi:regulator of protease activity HflC (stomatin/prohibitin superfamily)